MNSRALTEVALFGSVLMGAGTSFSLATSQAAGKPVARVQTVSVIRGSNSMEVEIAASQSVAVRSQVATNPDRLVLDFPGALPGSGLRNQAINRGEVKGIRIGLFIRDPPVTRVVIDLKSAQPYRVYPSGKTVIVKLMMDQEQATMSARAETVSYKPRAPKAQPKLEVVYKNGRLSIWADNVSLAELLSQVASKTGADIPLPAKAAQEQVVVNIGPLPVRDALAALLNGSQFNFVLVGSDGDPANLKSVMLTFRGMRVAQPASDCRAPADGDQPEPEASPHPERQPQLQEGASQQENPQPQEDPRQQEAPQPPEAQPPQ
jgi:hypothetical protein